ncbi:transcriptional regulator [Halobacteroides halobius DSM 5150]|uniref:Transcriptional regulator n=1 Tax=Halobacteroides halobius (strain ATCC 35273 / DSM 5150 / MD-1) TaxID=748449 RepID=L0K9A6_HALHC|nr:LysR family transcriptional regulator [Halobacteroides halobius]AGB41601.1 transcriptional regulator [Halobacteroides halobius DSM 5150]
MNLRQLKIFKKVCQTGTMSQAADQMYITQPAISQTISDLESKLEVKLFERLNQKLVLTYAGKILLEYSNKILLLVDEVENSIEGISNLKQGKLRIGASMTIGTYLLPNIINQFNNEYKSIEINLTIDNSSIIEELILDNQIDIGLVEGPTQSKDITTDSFFVDHLNLVCSPQHRWANQKLITPTQFHNESFIMREEGSGTREVIEDILAKHKLSYKIKHVLNNIEAIKKAVSANIGISVLPKIAIQEEIDAGELVTAKIKDINFIRKFSLIHHQDKYKSKLFKKFISYLKEKASTKK